MTKRLQDLQFIFTDNEELNERYEVVGSHESVTRLEGE